MMVFFLTNIGCGKPCPILIHVALTFKVQAWLPKSFKEELKLKTF